ncbi:uncharacterized protein LOC114769735 isoform X2 [Denticeps clupeoides]|uniref:uncharacterized protein LOC114769735 isoform X2 n=1 Tax=Denticeps clupeoides TaxID=299321 RepID=UPI0010A2F664|nr:uncharacterized protein LOC114769735 isoform X2 [Denticeps clupeoides]
MMHRYYSTSAALILVFLQAGISNSGISVTQKWMEGALNLTCTISGNTTVTQINWVMGASKQINLAIFHPKLGMYVPECYLEDVGIDGDKDHVCFSSLILKKGAMNESNVFCCQFITFPAGKLESCIDSSLSSVTKALEHNTYKMAQFLKEWLLLSGAIGLVFLIVSISIFCIWRKCCRSVKVFEVQISSLTDWSPDSEANTNEAIPEDPPVPPPPQSHPTGFDPSKLYAKIKVDLYYGRLWKSYQGTRPQTLPSRNMYALLGQHSVKKSEETGALPAEMPAQTTQQEHSENS